MSYQQSIRFFESISIATMRPKGFLNRATEDSKEKIERVTKGHGWKNVERCPLCGAQEKNKEFAKFGIEIVGCVKCSLRYCTQIPVETADIYANDSYVTSLEEGYMKSYEYRKERFGPERISLIRQFLKNTKSPRLLDLGCGSGWFLDFAMQQGFDVCGQELGKSVAHWTSERLKIKVFSGPVESIPKIEKFDAVTLFDLIEHVPEPVHLIEEAKSLLKQGGILVVYTPHFDSLGIQIMREHSNLVTPSEHLTYFTREAVEKLAESTDTELIYCKTFGIDLGDLKSYFESEGKLEESKACESLYNIMQPIIDTAFCGNHMRFVLRKKD